jgi:hypothetical protein
MGKTEQIEHLISLFYENQEREQKKLEIIKDPAKKNFHILSFKGINTIFFLHKAFVENDIQASKVFLYKVAMTNGYYYEKLNGEIFNVLDTFTYPILSDSSNLIRRYLKYERTEHPDSFSTYFGKAIQSVLKDDQQALQSNIEGLKKWSKKGWAKQYSGIITVFEGFFVNDKTIIEKGLQEIIALHEKQEQPAVIKDYINLEATALAKLSYRKGLEIDIDYSLIPKELLPIKELPNYEGYPFFDELKSQA